MLRLKAELLLAENAELGEGLQFFPDGDLRWVDLLAGRVFRLRPDGNELVHDFGHAVSRVLPAENGSIALGHLGPIAIDADGSVVGFLPVIDPQSNLRLSDGAVLPDGSIAFGIVDRDLAPKAGSLIHLTSELELKELISGCSIPNGISMLPGDQELIWLDSPTSRLFLLDWDKNTCQLSEPRFFAEIPDELGVPDGLCVDSHGDCWVAMWGGGKVVRVNSAGTIDCVVDVGTKDVTSCAFDRDNNLIISTASVNIVAHERTGNDGAGGLWIVKADAHGRKARSISIATRSRLFG